MSKLKGTGGSHDYGQKVGLGDEGFTTNFTFEEGEVVQFLFKNNGNTYTLGLNLNTHYFIFELENLTPFIELGKQGIEEKETVSYQDFVDLKERFAGAVVQEGREAYARFLKIKEETGITKHVGGLRPPGDFELLKQWFVRMMEEMLAPYQELGKEELQKLQEEIVRKELDTSQQLAARKLQPQDKLAVKIKLVNSKFASWLQEEFLPVEDERGQLTGLQARKFWTEKLILIGYMQEEGHFPTYEVASKLHDFLAQLLGTSTQTVKQAQRKARSIMYTNPANDAQGRKWLEQLGWVKQQAQVIDLRKVVQLWISV